MMGYHRTAERSAPGEPVVECCESKSGLTNLMRYLRVNILRKGAAGGRNGSKLGDDSLCKCNLPNSVRLITPPLISEDDLEVISLIGYGDLGRVYLTRDKNTDKLYATKVISKRKAAHRNKISRILTEQRILLTLNHPFLARLCHSFHNDRNVYLVMEYCAGGELFRRLQSLPNRSISEEDAKFYAAEVLCALEYLHLMGFIYRDLKPENILLSEDGHIVLSDFDLSRRADSECLSESLPPKVIKRQVPRILSASSSTLQIDTRSCTDNITASSFVGTEEYISPEIITHRTHTSAVDWWTLGILIYELVHGYSPFKGPTKHATFNNIIKKEVVFHVPLSGKCKRIIKSLLQKDPEKRLGSSTGASEIKMHSFFDGIVWDLLRNCKPPQLWDMKTPLAIRAEEPTPKVSDSAFFLCPSTPSPSKRQASVRSTFRGGSNYLARCANPSPPVSSSSSIRKLIIPSNMEKLGSDAFSEVLSASLLYNV